MLNAVIIMVCSLYPQNLSCQHDLNECVDRKIWERLDLVNDTYNVQWEIDALKECSLEVKNDGVEK